MWSMLADLAAAAAQTLSPQFRTSLWKTLALTVLFLALAWFGLERLVLSTLGHATIWIRLPLSILTGAGFLFCAAYLIAPISALVAGFYADDLAALVEWELDPRTLGRALPFGLALRVGARFAGLALVVNAIALVLLFVPGVNVLAFLTANAYLLGRVYFELAALRHRSQAEALELYRKHAGAIFACGLCIAVFLSIPLVNLLTPLFAVAFMVRVYNRLDPASLRHLTLEPAPEARRRSR